MHPLVFAQRLLGHMDLDTREWFDGVLTDAARKVVKEPQEVWHGQVDPSSREAPPSMVPTAPPSYEGGVA